MSSSDPHGNDALPPGWARQYSKSQGKNFYFHKDTKHTQWHFPTASEAVDPLKAKRRADEANKKRSNPATSLSSNDANGQKPSIGSSSSDSKRSRTSNNNGSAAVGVATSSSTAARSSMYSSTTDDFLDLADSTSVAIIVPYRDLHVEQKRSEHLKKFVPHMVKFLSKIKNNGLVSDYHVYIIEQSNDGYKFNRGKLLNIGYDFARKSGRKHDVFIFHDVDLLPQDDLSSWYVKFPKTPIHIARVWKRYSGNPKYIGGVVSFSSSDYKRINGFPNNYWGWGGEDDEMQRRLERLGIKFESPDNGTLIDLEDMTVQEKMDFLRQHKSWKCMVKWELKDEHESTWKINGLSDLKYNIVSSSNLHESKKATKVTANILLNGKSHWTNEKAGVEFVG